MLFSIKHLPVSSENLGGDFGSFYLFFHPRHRAQGVILPILGVIHPVYFLRCYSPLPLQDLEKEKELRRKMELEAAQINLKYQMAMEELQRMKTQLKTTQQQQQGMARNQAGCV